MTDGRFKRVEEIASGEFVMGDDGTPRVVSGVTKGRQRMARVTALDSKSSFVCNLSHVLSLHIANAVHVDRTQCRVSVVVARNVNYGVAEQLQEQSITCASSEEADVIVSLLADRRTSDSMDIDDSPLVAHLRSMLNVAKDDFIVTNRVDIALNDFFDSRKVSAETRSRCTLFHAAEMHFPDELVGCVRVCACFCSPLT